VIRLFADYEQSDAVVRINVVEVVDVGSDELENEHDVVSSVKIKLLVFFQC
jgi:hypothetical protein